MCIVLAKITELEGKIKMLAGWHFMNLVLRWTVVGWPRLADNSGLVVRAAALYCRDPSLVPQKAEDLFVNSSEILKFLWKTNNERGGRPDWAILSAAYASPKTWEC